MNRKVLMLFSCTRARSSLAVRSRWMMTLMNWRAAIRLRLVRASMLLGGMHIRLVFAVARHCQD